MIFGETDDEVSVVALSWAECDNSSFDMSCFESAAPNPSSLCPKSGAATATYHWTITYSKSENKFRASSERKRLKMSPSPTFETDGREDGAVPLQFRSKWQQIVSLGAAVLYLDNLLPF